MAIEDSIDASDEWFVGEDRDLRFTLVAGVVAGVESWTMKLRFYPRRSKPTDTPLLEVDAVGHAAVDADPDADPPVEFLPAYATARVTAAESTTLGAGIYQYVLRRVDSGAAGVLSYGAAELREAATA